MRMQALLFGTFIRMMLLLVCLYRKSPEVHVSFRSHATYYNTRYRIFIRAIWNDVNTTSLPNQSLSSKILDENLMTYNDTQFKFEYKIHHILCDNTLLVVSLHRRNDYSMVIIHIYIMVKIVIFSYLPLLFLHKMFLQFQTLFCGFLKSTGSGQTTFP